MKRFIAVLSSLLVLPAFAEVAPVYYDEIVEYTDEAMDNQEEMPEESVKSESTAKQNVAQRTTINRSNATSRAISAGNAGTSTRTNTSSRAVASSRATSGTTRGTVARTATNTVTARNAKTSRATVTSRNTQNTKPLTARVGTSSNSVMPANRYLTKSSTATLTDSGAPLYNANNARVSVGNRRPTTRLASIASAPQTPTITQEDVTSTADNLTAITELTDYCKAQYAACMDNYCNVLDDNQGRCSCSKNLKNYEKTEAALTQATEAFQEAVQKIRYIGLTGPQIEALFAETEAEISMKSNSDSSRLKNSLDAIKKKIVDVSTSSSSAYDVTNGLSLDLNGLLNADFTSGFDLNSFLNINGSNTSSVSNQRGETLYKTAQNRCKTMVLNSCVNQGIDANVITNSYDLEIDKQCMAYERSLNEANTEMRNNVTNATNILQQARLLLAQNRNSYDLRGCVAAIDSCMQDDYVCGSDYELCLDPTGKYLANGEIVKGGTPGVSGGQNVNPKELSSDNMEKWTSGGSGGMYNLYATWNYDDNKNAWGVGTTENLGEYIDEAITEWGKVYNTSKNADKTGNMAIYLLQKIGYIDKDDKVHGMCASVMKQCQDYAFDVKKNNKKYKYDNEVVRQYLNNTLASIKVKQDAIIADYAEGCRADVESCLSTNGYDESNTDSTASKTAVNACASEITTCMSVGGYQVKDGVRLTLRAMTDWVASILINCPVNYYLVDDGIGDGTLLNNSNGGTKGTTKVVCKACNVLNGVATESSGGQATRCSCPDGYYDVTNDNGELVGCSKTNCNTNEYLEQNNNIWSCKACPSTEDSPAIQLVSVGGTVTTCSCPADTPNSDDTDNDGIPNSCSANP